MKIYPEDKYFSDFIKQRDGYTCQRCGRYFPEGQRYGLHCSHYMGRGNKATRQDEENCDAMCNGCHSYFEERKQTDYRDWKIGQMGYDKVHDLEMRSRKSIKYDKIFRSKIAKKYRSKLNEKP